MVTQEIDHRGRIAAAATPDEVIEVLRALGLESVAERLAYLLGLSIDDPEEPPLNFESMLALADLLVCNDRVPEPVLSTDPDGLLLAEWRVPPEGLMAFEFLPDGRIRFAAISAPATRGTERTSVYGTLPKDEALAAVAPFLLEIGHS